MDRLPFHPLVRSWFGRRFAGPTPVQVGGWDAIASGRDVLIAAPTGSGKTLAAFLWAVNGLVEAAVAGCVDEHVHVVYVSPLKALGNDIEKNLQGPLAEIGSLAEAAGLTLDGIRVAVRTGDTPARERALQARRPPHILITTPESLYILLTAEKSRRALAPARTVIVDEIHAVAADKRGAHLALSLERLDALAGRPLQRVGLSATQKPIEVVARLLTGAGRSPSSAPPTCEIVDGGHRRDIDLRIETVDVELGPMASHELRAAVHKRIAELVATHRTTIVFVNTRRMVERVAHALADLIGSDRVAAHHGSLARELRLDAEEGLKSGRLSVVVATASLELGIDVGHVDLVVHLGAPRALATLLQRVGRSGHFLGAVPNGVLFPLTRDELLQSAAAVAAVHDGDLDALQIPPPSLSILAQQIVASVAAEPDGIDVERLWKMVRRAYPYRDIHRQAFDAVVDMLAEGVSTRRGRRSAHLHYDRINLRLRPRRGARLAAITSGGSIPDTADYDVIEEPAGASVGKVNEDFAVESMAGDVFLLGNRSWRIRRVTAGQILVIDAAGAAPTIPFWLGEAPARTAELSAAVSRLRRDVAARCKEPDAAVRWVCERCHLDRAGAAQLVDYVRETLAVLGEVPTCDTLIAERFFDESGGMQLVLHAPLGGRVNRALGLSLRKRFCRSFDFELQAAATDDGVVLSLGEQHSFPLADVFAMVRSSTFEKDLVQAALASPMFTNRWRWNASRALALLRYSGGRRVPLPLQRMRAEDLLAAVFPAQLGCQDNRSGDIELPDHPLVAETMGDCLHEAMDADGLRDVLEAVESGRMRTLAIETPVPSAMSHEILNANPYAFLDDAPLEERRARAVALRRTDPDLATGIGALDPAAIRAVREQAWPDPRNADEVHDALLSLVVVPEREVAAWREHIDALVSCGRATRVVRGEGDFSDMVAASERASAVRSLYPNAELRPPPPALEPLRPRNPKASDEADPGEQALLETVRGWLDAVGPITASRLAASLGVEHLRVEWALAALESLGVAIRGTFEATQQAGDGALQWCERGLLARIHRLTIGKLRQEIEPVSQADLMRFLFAWQHAAPATRLHGKDGVRTVIAQLGGLELPGPAWERDVLPLRIADYDPADLEQLCLAGEIAWGRLAVRSPAADEPAPDGDPLRRRRGAPTRAVPLAFALREDLPDLLEPPDSDGWRDELSATARAALALLESRGASFLADIARAIGCLPSQAEEALWELVASGLVTGDGVAGLRTLLLPDHKRRQRERRRNGHLRALPGRASRSGRMMPLGRWALLASSGCTRLDETERAERCAQRLLARYGVVFRELCARERRLPPWRSLLHALRRMEARGEVRGGRFVAGVVGEQFALPQAVESLRAVRRRRCDDETIVVAAADPLNLVGIVTAGARVQVTSGQVVAYRNGCPIEIGELGKVRSRLQGWSG